MCGGGEGEGQEFTVILRYKVSLRPAWLGLHERRCLRERSINSLFLLELLTTDASYRLP